MSGRSQNRRRDWDNSRAVYWDSCVILTTLIGNHHELRNFLELAEEGSVLIATSQFAEIEVSYLPDLDDDLRIIEKFFAQPYVFTLPIRKDVRIEARNLVRDLSLRGADALHVATALRWNIPAFETFDQDLLKKIANNPSRIGGLEVRQPDPTSAPPGSAARLRLPGM
ncbi:MAG: hypothetical protein KatS3mg015_3207 [Fimbriimonadales bacterium]|nr:MAG: hypothetical protein KatS3mg015_3207 [Fimbriimonadales bacterium]